VNLFNASKNAKKLAFKKKRTFKILYFIGANATTHNKTKASTVFCFVCCAIFFSFQDPPTAEKNIKQKTVCKKKIKRKGETNLLPV